MKRSRRKKSGFDIAFVIVNTIVLTIFCIVTLYPILNTLAVSFNEAVDTLTGGIHLVPRKFTLENYRTVFRTRTLMHSAYISVLRTVLGTLLHMVLTSLLAYVLSRKEFLFNRQVSLFYVLTMYVSGGMIPGLLLFKSIGLTNTFWVYIIPGAISAFNMIVIRTYMNGLPDSLVESAQVDGAGHFRIFLKIILPLCKPVLATIALFIAVGQWNAWFDVMIYNASRPDLSTLQYELMKLLSSVSQQSGDPNMAKHAANMVTPESIRAAATIVTALPIVCLYPFLQRYFVTGLTIGGVKE
ncbi:MAG TPA: sugar ABC transporter permease [Lachnospiraceae bacterium]|jgi:putative aldouronate transport system permease protein|nr:sugar ABC transporter permease [Lachnospiraceae bacterium]HBY72034.1 sugar ABC transporter permease [Lachnospiraceae bacterium]HCA69060.1 sugar ABC transporter permease [Lachnospiraceae bacterium]HCM13869.1 sugar ABC transporter permease [Lachnospiraceae bacterium]HCR41326.1 sugar ABC transporter permease [Lachnospiraceae bacterium]